MAKKKEPAPAPGSPAWMTTYGDMVTLLLTFFVLLFSFSSIDAAKWQGLVSAFTGSTGIWDGQDLPSNIDDIWGEPHGSAEETEEEELGNLGEIVDEPDEWETVIHDIIQYVQGAGLAGNATVESNEFEIVVRVPGDILFDSAKADIKEEAKPFILGFFEERVWPYIDEFSTIRIEGHTDNIPIRNGVFSDNVQLSQRRSWAVWDFIVNTYPAAHPDYPKLDPTMVDCNGRGEYHPIDTNDTEAGRAHNRRVDFVLVRKLDTTDPQKSSGG